MHRRGTALLAVFLLAAAGAFAAAGATAEPSTRAAPLVNSVTYSDSTGEDPAAPDITTVVVSNNDAADLTVQANISNRPGLTPDMLLLLFVDSDNNEVTGDPDSLGADYLIQLVPGSVSMFRWNGSDYTSDGVSQTTLTYSYSNGATIRVNASELGGTTAFRFAVLVASGVVFDPATGEPSFDNIKVDVAPDPGHGLFAYEVKITPLSLVVKRSGTRPVVPRADRPFTAFFVVARSDTGATIKSGRVTCRATVAFKAIRALASALENGRASCTWLIPRNARGKTLRVTIALQFEGLTAKRSFVFKIA